MSKIYDRDHHIASLLNVNVKIQRQTLCEVICAYFIVYTHCCMASSLAFLTHR